MLYRATRFGRLLRLRKAPFALEIGPYYEVVQSELRQDRVAGGFYIGLAASPSATFIRALRDMVRKPRAGAVRGLT